jgi:hypothetical protein
MNNIQASSNTFTLLSLFNSSNNYFSNQLNTKQDILNATCNLVGFGSAISSIDCNKITINKPTNFPRQLWWARRPRRGTAW